MERAILRKAWADLRGHRLQNALILLTLIAATATLTVSLVTNAGADDPYERVFKQSNGAHVVVFSGPTAESPAPDLSTIAGLPGVSETAGPFPTIYGGLVHDGLKYDVQLAALGNERPAVATPIVTDGHWLDAEAGQMLLSRDFADEFNIEVGDEILIIGQGGDPVPAQVVGLVVDTSRAPYPEDDPVGYVSAATFAQATPDQAIWRSVLAVRLTDPENTGAFLGEVRRAMPDARLGFDFWDETRETYVLWAEVFSILLGLFAAFALVAVGLIIANIIGARVLAQFRDIGMLKAVGFTPGQVVRVFQIQHLLLALVGGVVGIALGSLLAPLMLQRTADALNTTAATGFQPGIALGILLGTLAIVAFFTWLPARRGARIPVVQAIAHGAGAVASRPSPAARLALRLRLHPVLALGLKDAFARPWRAALTIAALLLTAVTFIFTLGTQATLDGILNDPALEGDVFDVLVVPRALSAAETEAILAEHPEIANLYTRTSLFIPLSREGEGDDGFTIRAMDGGYAQAGYLVPEGRMFAAADEAVAGRGLLDKLGLQVGDTITFDVPAEGDRNGDAGTLRLTIVGRYVTDDNNGDELMFQREALLALQPDSQPTAFAVQLAPGTNIKAFQRALYQASNYDFNMETGIDDTPPEVGILRNLLYVLSAVLLLIGMINLVSTSLLNVWERRRDYAIGKTVGLTPTQTMASVVTSVATLAFLAVILGIPAGILIYKLFFQVIAIGMLNAEPEYYAGPPWWQMLLLIPCGVLIAAIASGLPARFAARVNVAEALRYE